MKSKFFHLISEYSKQKVNFISLGLGESDKPEASFIYEEAKQNLEFNQTRYSDPSGIKELKTEICNKLSSQNGIDCSEKNIMVTFGAKEALFLTALSILEDGDEVVLFTPGYVSNIPILQILKRNVKIVKVPLVAPNFHIDFDNLEKAFTSKTKLLWVNYPNNPTGAVLKEEEYLRICEIVEKRNIYLLSDEIYDKLVFDDVKYLSFAANSSIFNKTITINSLSKSFNMTGWRVGYICANPEIVSSMKEIQKNIIGNVPVFIQKAAISALRNGQNYLNELKDDLQKRKDFLINALGNSKLIKISNPQGGFFSFINISKIRETSDEFAYELLRKEKVAVLPGYLLGNEFDKYIRISMAVNSKDFIESINRIKKFIEGA